MHVTKLKTTARGHQTRREPEPSYMSHSVHGCTYEDSPSPTSCPGTRSRNHCTVTLIIDSPLRAEYARSHASREQQSRRKG
ncbi:hypothetical protein PUN28_020024 [Cardiocondyla obscurior]|uniref:Uncharacterized protein n=1 Tax=Cardiocondyla obscurior TaxID=286306 RepID=A0AAW2E828_9HYME